VQDQLARGIDGTLVLEELRKLGYDDEKNPHFTQSLLKPNSQLVCVNAAIYDFWQCLIKGNLQEVSQIKYIRSISNSLIESNGY